MALQSSGQISLNDVNVELNNSGTAQIGLGDSAVRDLFDIPSGEIEMADGYGKSNISYMAATGGTVATYGNFKVHTFTSSGTLNVTAAGSPDNTVEFLVIAGGGGGDDDSSGGSGGGAGGYRTSYGTSGGNSPAESNLALPTGSYSVIVGAGGSIDAKGSNSSISSITSEGGGRGMEPSSDTQANGGSGGGAASGTTAAGGTAVSGQGMPGGGGFNTGGHTGHGGGGAGQAGQAGSGNAGGTAGRGGEGLFNSITGSSVQRGGGGGGGSFRNPNEIPGYGGAGGGGNGSWYSQTSGQANTGGGGGGNNYYQGGVGAGGSGLVVIRYQFQA